MSAAALVLFLFLCSFTSAAAQETNFQINISSSLAPTTNPIWLSSSRTFAFGFYPTPNGYAICIFFSSYLDRSTTVVWTANTEDPIIPDNNMVLVLTTDGLVLRKFESREPFSRIDNSSQPIAGASMLDNGNFVLFNSHGSVVWQTFDHPTNSLLSGQSLSHGMQLVSCASETDLKRGIFRLKMQTDGNLVLYNLDSLDVTEDAYYASGTNGNRNVSLILETDGNLYLFNGASILMNLTMGEGYHASGVYLLRIDFDGIFRVYNRSLQPDDDWRPIWSVTEDKCQPKGLCGINSYCIYKDGNAADCRCLPGYDPVSSGVWGAGCTSSLVVDCSDKDQSSKFEMTRIQNVLWEDNYYSVLNGKSEEGCEEACLKDCSCGVALFRDGQCRKQQLPLRYGRWLGVVEDVAFVRVTNSSTGNKICAQTYQFCMYFMFIMPAEAFLMFRHYYFSFRISMDFKT